MKNFFSRNRALVIALAAVLGFGAIFWSTMTLFRNVKMQDVLITTSAAEAEEKEAFRADPDLFEITPQPEPTPTPQPDEMMERILQREWRYKDLFPRITNIYSYIAKTWKEGDPVEPGLEQKAIATVRNIYSTILNRDLGEGLSAIRYVDESGYRGNVLRITNEAQDFVCCLLEKNLQVLVADNTVIQNTGSSDWKKDADKIAKLLGVEVGTDIGTNTYFHGRNTDANGTVLEEAMSFATTGGACPFVTVSYAMGNLVGFMVHPSDAAMREMVPFDADIRYDDAVVHLVAPENFIPGDLTNIQEGDMSPADAELIYRNFVSAANGRAVERREAEGKTVEELDYNLEGDEISYVLDRSGYRENYYHIEKKNLIVMDIAAKSGFIVRATCNALYSMEPELDLRSIPYDHMGEEQYISYVTNIASKTFAPEEIDRVDVNAVYDGNYCTIDIEMKSGEWYELGFTGGCLMYVEHYPTRMADMAGWAADSTYINTITGEIFIQEW